MLNFYIFTSQNLLTWSYHLFLHLLNKGKQSITFLSYLSRNLTSFTFHIIKHLIHFRMKHESHTHISMHSNKNKFHQSVLKVNEHFWFIFNGWKVFSKLFMLLLNLKHIRKLTNILYSYVCFYCMQAVKFSYVYFSTSLGIKFIYTFSGEIELSTLPIIKYFINFLGGCCMKAEIV